jgi:hypothetical protein
VGDSRIILADEVGACQMSELFLLEICTHVQPTTGLDAASRRRVWRILDRARAGRVVILVSHDMAGALLHMYFQLTPLQTILCNCRGGSACISHWHHDVRPSKMPGPTTSASQLASPFLHHRSCLLQHLKARYGGGYRLHVNYAIDGSGVAAVAAAAERSRAASANISVPGSLPVSTVVRCSLCDHFHDDCCSRCHRHLLQSCLLLRQQPPRRSH